MGSLERYYEKFNVMAELSRKLASLSSCARLKVGAVITDHTFTRILSIGYNGPPSGKPNDSCTGATPCGCVHAEANALIKLRSRPVFLICTHTPCPHCEGMLINVGIKEVFAWEAYRIAPTIPVTIIGDHFETLKRRHSLSRPRRLTNP